MLTCKKKKRSILKEAVGGTLENINPAAPVKSFEETEDEKNDDMDLTSGIEEVSQREGKFLKYWLTTTLTTTYTTYTGTSSVASLICTPADYTNDGCPGLG